LSHTLDGDLRCTKVSSLEAAVYRFSYLDDNGIPVISYGGFAYHVRWATAQMETFRGTPRTQAVRRAARRTASSARSASLSAASRSMS